jgi:hypothetical protein
MNMKKTAISAAISVTLGASAAFLPQVASATVFDYSWTGVFTMLDSAGNALTNTSAAKGTNAFQTNITGTMSFDTVTGAGTATLVPFNFFSGTAPAAAVGINMQAIGDGMGGAGSLVLGNMLFNWDGKNGIPVSIVLDAAGFFGSQTDPANPWADGTLNGTDVAAYGAIPAADGTYTNATYGYLNLGPLPMATTEWNTTNGPGCVFGVDSNYADNTGGGCMGISPSGVLPLVTDLSANGAEYAQGDGVGIGGAPMQDGPFQNFSANFDVLTLTALGVSATPSIGPFCDFDPSGNLCAPPAIPIPAAVWLFGSGLIGLVGVARRKKKA